MIAKCMYKYINKKRVIFNLPKQNIDYKKEYENLSLLYWDIKKKWLDSEEREKKLKYYIDNLESSHERLRKVYIEVNSKKENVEESLKSSTIIKSVLQEELEIKKKNEINFLKKELELKNQISNFNYIFQKQNIEYEKNISKLSKDYETNISKLKEEISKQTTDYETIISQLKEENLSLKTKNINKKEKIKILKNQLSTSKKLEKFTNTKKGLANIGNSCFMNAALQCLINTIPLSDYFLNKNYIKDQNKLSSKTNLELSNYYYDFINNISNNKIISCDSLMYFKEKIMGLFDSKYATYSQEDSHEFLLYLLNGLHNDLNLEKINYADKKIFNSVIANLFNIRQMNTFKCEKCDFQIINYSNSNTIPLFLDKFKEKQNLFEIFKKSLVERMESFCETCNSLKFFIKKTVIHNSPNIFIFNLQKFEIDRYGEHRKISKFVDFPLQFTLSELIDKNDKNSLEKYDLYAIINHDGSKNGGHYYSYIKLKSENSWYIVNDNRDWTKIKESDIKTKSSYILFYEKN